MGKYFPQCQATLSPSDGKELPMAAKSSSPRLVFAKNLKGLIEASGVSAPEIARRAGVDRKTVNNQLNARFDPRPELVDAVAKVFGIEGWMLLSDSFDPENSLNTNLTRLIELFKASNELGRDSILKIAEMAAQLNPPKT